MGDYTVADSFDKVWEFYAKKLGTGLKSYSPGLGTSGGGTDANDEYSVTVMTSDDRPEIPKSRPEVKCATLARHTAHATVTVFVSRAKAEDKTYFNLVVARK